MKKYIIPVLAVLLVVSVGFNIWQVTKTEQERRSREDRFVTVFLRKLDDACDCLETFLEKNNATRTNTTFVPASMQTVEALLESSKELYRMPMPSDEFARLAIVYSGGSFSSAFGVKNIWEDGIVSSTERQFTRELLEQLEKIASYVEANAEQEGKMNALWNGLKAFCETMEDAEKSPYRLISANSDGK